MFYTACTVPFLHIWKKSNKLIQKILCRKLLKVALQEKEHMLTLYETCEFQICNSQLVTYSVVMNCCACDCFTRKVELQDLSMMMAKEIFGQCTPSCHPVYIVFTVYTIHQPSQNLYVFLSKFRPHPIAIMILHKENHVFLWKYF